MPTTRGGPASSLDLALLTGAVLLALDQVTKLLALTFIEPITATTVVPATTLSLLRTWNPGATLIPASSDPAVTETTTTILIVVGIIAVSALLRLARRRSGIVVAIGCGVALASLLGNTLDRIFHRAVIDWVTLPLGSDGAFIVFNLADVLGLVSVVVLVPALVWRWLHRDPPDDGYAEDGLIEVGPLELGVVHPFRRW